MNHPLIVHSKKEINSIAFTNDKLQKLLAKPKPILWEQEGEYIWIPIEKVRAAIKWYYKKYKVIFPPASDIIFVKGDAVPIPKEAGDVIVKYNGHES